jgi:hypothetical protein
MNASLKINSIGCVLTPGTMFFSTQLSLNGLIKIIFINFPNNVIIIKAKLLLPRA